MKPGDKVGRYELEELLGEGAMAQVFAARQPLRERRLALKILKREIRGDTQYVARFLGDARAADRLDHPNIVRVLDVDDTTAEAPFIVMELVEGPSLDQVLAERGRLPAHEAARIAREVALGLAAAHAAGIVHRDVKPSNVLMDRRAGVAKLTDFGAAKHATTPGSPSLSFHGQIIGTPRYMAPEQIEGAGPVDARADLFALGTTLYEMLAGAPAFPGEGLATTLHAVLHTSPAGLAQVRPDLPPGLADLVDRLLAKAPGDRPASATEVAEALAPFAVTAPAAAPIPAEGRPAPPPPVLQTTAPSPPPPTGGKKTPPEPATAPGREKGGTSMQRLSTLIIGGVALAAVALVVWLLLPGGETPVPPPGGDRAADGTAVTPPPPVPVPPTTSPTEPPVAPAPPATDTAPPPTPPPPTGTETARPLEPATPPEPVPDPPSETATAPAVPPPPPPAPPEPDLAAVRAALATVPCLAGDATLETGGQVRLTGTAAHPALVMEAQEKVAAVPDVAAVDEAGLTVVEQPGCYGATRLEREIAAAGGGPPPELALNKPDGVYLDQDFLVIQAAMPPGLAGHLYVDVLTDAGAVYHLLPEELTPDNALPAGGRIRIGVEAAERRQGVRDWQASPPFGPAYVVVTASERPLLPALREVEEPGGPYVDLLLKALAETPGAKSMRVQRVEFRPRP